MYALVTIAIFTFLAAVIGNQINTDVVLIKAYRSSSSQNDLRNLSNAVREFYLEKNVFPSSFQTLIATPGFEHARSFTNNNQSFFISGNITDGVWTFQRGVVANFSRLNGATPISYGAANTCGSGTVLVDSSWCGQIDSNWVRVESREFFNQQLVDQRVRQQRFLQKFTDYFNDQGSFPNKDFSNVNLVVGGTYQLSSLVGYAGAGNVCTGIFNFQGVPVDCNDMFDRWGNPVIYVYFSNKHVGLVSSSSILNSSGNKIQIATDLDAS